MRTRRERSGYSIGKSLRNRIYQNCHGRLHVQIRRSRPSFLSITTDIYLLGFLFSLIFEYTSSAEQHIIVVTLTMPDKNKGCKITLYWYVPTVFVYRHRLIPSRLEQSRSHRILWLLEELQLQYELKIFKRRADKLAPAELKQVHPLGKSPVITIAAPGSSKPIVLAESGAIVEYLCDHFGEGRPTLVPKRYRPGQEGQVGGEREEWMRYRYFMHYVEGSLMPFLVMTLVNDSKLTHD